MAQPAEVATEPDPVRIEITYIETEVINRYKAAHLAKVRRRCRQRVSALAVLAGLLVICAFIWHGHGMVTLGLLVAAILAAGAAATVWWWGRHVHWYRLRITGEDIQIALIEAHWMPESVRKKAASLHGDRPSADFILLLCGADPVIGIDGVAGKPQGIGWFDVFDRHGVVDLAPYGHAA